uniref:GST zeta n=1 Tax=Tigriopus kingsejongensis TaxID=1133412 RepID=A0A1L3THX3_9MAXI|nr:GST zeta [Tigriopus kingsejongensis]
MTKPVLYSYFRSSCSWRVRIVLALKDIEYEYRPVHLVKDGGEQHQADFLKLNPMAQVPALTMGDRILTQSVAIIEYLEEAYPQHPILPTDPWLRAQVRQIVEIIGSGTQPVQNLSVMKMARDDPAQRVEWSHYWIRQGLSAVESVLSQTAGRYCVGDEVTMADCCLVPQIYNAERQVGQARASSALTFDLVLDSKST